MLINVNEHIIGYYDLLTNACYKDWNINLDRNIQVNINTARASVLKMAEISRRFHNAFIVSSLEKIFEDLRASIPFYQLALWVRCPSGKNTNNYIK